MTTDVIATLETKFTADTSGFMAGMSQVQNGLANGARNIGSRLTGIGNSMTMMGLQLGLAIAPIAGAFGAATNMAINFESAFAGVAKTVDATDAELATLRATILRMATDSTNPLSGLTNAPELLAQIGEIGGQLGISVEAMEGFISTVGMLTMSTNLTADAAATMMGQFANITQMPVADFERFGSTLVDLGNKGASTELEIMTFAARLGGIGQVIGLTVPQILALSSTMASLGINAEAGGTAMTTVFNKMLTDVAAGTGLFAETIGVTAEEFSTLLLESPIDALTALQTALSGMDAIEMTTTLTELGLGAIRVSDLMRRLAGGTDLLAQNLLWADEAWGENTAMMTEAEKRFATTAAQMNLMHNQVRYLGITVGSFLLPSLNSTLAVVGRLAMVFATWAEKHPTLIGLIARLVFALSGLATVLIVGGQLVKLLGMSFSILGVLINTVGLPVLLAIAGIALAIQTNFLGIRDVIDKITTAFRIFFQVLRGDGDLLFNPEQLGLSAGTITKIATFANRTRSIFNQISGAFRVFTQTWQYGKNVLFNPEQLGLSTSTITKIAAFANRIRSVFNLITNSVRVFILTLRYGKEVLFNPERLGLSAGAIARIVAFANRLKGALDKIIDALRGFTAIVKMTVGRAMETFQDFFAMIGDGFDPLEALRRALVNLFGADITQKIWGTVTLLAKSFGLFVGALKLAIAPVESFLTTLFGGGSVLESFHNALSTLFTNIPIFFTDIVFPGIANIVTWVNDSIVTPLDVALAGVNWTETGMAIVNGIGAAMAISVDWVYTHIVQPLAAAVGSVDFGAVLVAVSNLLTGILLLLSAQLAQTVVVILYDIGYEIGRLPGRVISYLIEHPEVIAAIGKFLLAVGMVVVIIVAALAMGLLMGLLRSLEDVLDAFVELDLLTQVLTGLGIALLFVCPPLGILVLGLAVLSNIFPQVGTAIDNFLDGAWRRIKEAFEIFKLRFVDPITEAIAGIRDLLNGDWDSALNHFKSAFSRAFTTILIMVGNLVKTIGDIATAIRDVTNALGITEEAPTTSTYSGAVYPGVQGATVDISSLPAGVGTVSGPGWSPPIPPNLGGYPGQQGGTPWTGSGALSEIAGFVHNREAVVPAHGMYVTPSPGGLQLHGSSGNGKLISISNCTLIFQGVQDIPSLYDQIQREQMLRA